MFTITLTTKEQKSIASMINLTAPKDNFPALSMVKIVIRTDGILSAFATNRIIVGEQSFKLYYPVDGLEDGPIEFLLTPSLLKAMKLAKYDGNISVSDGAITYSNTGSPDLVDILPTVKFPDITEYLGSSMNIETIVPASSFIRLNLDYVANISKLVSTEDFGKEIPAYDLYTQERVAGGKAKPILFKRANILVVMQPMAVK